MDLVFNKGAPFKPFEQLMGVFPAARFVHTFRYKDMLFD
jgi:5'-3' exonuclease